MNDTTQIAAEAAWEEIIKRKLKYDMGDRAQFDSDCIAIIQSAASEDTKRLDWLFTDKGLDWICAMVERGRKVCRTTVDAAMKEQK